MTEIVKQNAPIISAEIKKAKNILLHCHPKPDPDSVGSALAMKFALEQLGKKVTLIKGDSNIPKSFAFPGVDSVLNKSYGEIDTSDFDLFIVLDSSSKGMISFKTDVIFPETMKVIVIDHHISNTKYGHINCIDETYPAVAQLLFDLFKEMGIKINHDIALNLFMGIYTDTGGFRFGSNPDTLSVASELVFFAPEYKDTNFIMENSNRKEKLAFEGLAYSSIKEYCEGKVAISEITFDQLKEKGIREDDFLASEIVNEIKSVVDYDIAISMVEVQPKEVKLSFRTRDFIKYDLTKIAVALGGGGHKGAAGARLLLTIPEAVEKVVKNIKEIYNL